MTYGWSRAAWRPSRDSGTIISDKTYPSILLRLRLPIALPY